MQRILKETLIALVCLAFGIFGLPALVFAVGQLIVGDYEAGLPGLYEAIGDSLFARRSYAWLMILSPYAGIQLIRLWFWLRRQRRSVS